MDELSFCCWRLKAAYEEDDPEHEVLVSTREFDETQWYINGLGHLYFLSVLRKLYRWRGIWEKG